MAMTWWIITGVGLFVLVGLALLWRRRSKLVPLLDASIITDGSRYSVHFEPRHPELKAIEYLWLVLCTAGRFVYIVGDSGDANHPAGRAGLIAHIAGLGEAVRNGEPDLFAAAGPSWAALVEPVGEVQRSIRVRLYYQDVLSRAAFTRLPPLWHRLQFHGTLTALASSGRELLGAEEHRWMVPMLGASLQRLSESYIDGTFDPSAIASLFSAPVEAFHHAKRDLQVLEAKVGFNLAERLGESKEDG